MQQAVSEASKVMKIISNKQSKKVEMYMLKTTITMLFLCNLRPSDKCRQQFEDHSSNGMGVTDAMHIGDDSYQRTTTDIDVGVVEVRHTVVSAAAAELQARDTAAGI